MSLLLNIGSGQRRFSEPWINADCVSREGQVPDVVMNALELWPWDDESAEIVCFHHVLEHFGCGEATPAIREAWRVLKPGGQLLVFVPDMRALARRWFTGQLSDQIYFTNLYGAYQSEEGDRHKWGFTIESLRDFLESCAEWKGVSLMMKETIPGADIAWDWWILSMRAVK